MVDDEEMLDFARSAIAGRPRQVKQSSVVSEEVTEILPGKLEPPPIQRFESRNQTLLPSCPTTELVCDSVSASKTKCGYQGFLTNVFYRHEEITHTANYDGPPTAHGSWTFINDTDPVTCEETNDCSGSITYNNGITTLDCACTETPAGCGGDNIFGGDYPQECEVTPSSDTEASCGGASNSIDVVLSDLYSTADLIANTIAELPAFSEEFCDSESEECDCTAVYNLSEDETSFTIQRLKYKFALSSPACAGMKITWNEHFVPDVGSLVDTPKDWTAVGDETESDVFTADDPPSNGVTMITDVAVDCFDCP